MNGGTGQKEYRAPDPDAYDPKMYHDLPVSGEVKDIFKYIEKYRIDCSELHLLSRENIFFRYQPQDIVLETKLKPFIPEFVPAIGDIDAFLKVRIGSRERKEKHDNYQVPRPDGKDDHLGLSVLDEPSARQSDAHVLSLQMRYTSKQPVASSLPTVHIHEIRIQNETNLPLGFQNVRSVANADRHPKAIEEWIHNISKLQKAKTVDTVQYRK